MVPSMAIDAHNGDVEMHKMEPRRICRPVVADSHNLVEEQDPDPHLSEKSDPDPVRNPIFKLY
jgi:hypothetical protein